MKLKPIVAALALLVSGNAVAAYHPVESKTDFLQAKLDRNQNAFYAESDWFKRIAFSGLVQVYGSATTDAVYSNPQGTNNPFLNFTRLTTLFPTGTKSSSDLWLSRANFYIDADVNDWTQVHMAFDFSNFASTALTAPIPITSGTASHMYMHYDERSYLGGNNNLFPTPDEAVINIGNFAKSQFYVQAGRKYLRFGNYVRNVTPITFTQMASQTLADAVEIGFVDISNFNGSFAVFRSSSRAQQPEHNINNFVAQLGYVYENGDFSADLSFDYMYDTTAVNYLGAPGSTLTANLSGGGIPTPIDTDRVGGFVATALLDWQAFDLIGQVYFTEKRFNPNQLAYGTSGLPNGNPVLVGADPVIWMVGAGYRFGVFNNDDTHFGVNFQMTHEAIGLLMPKYRVQGTIAHEYAKNTEVTLSFVYDHDYETSSAGSSGGPFAQPQQQRNPVVGTDDDSFTALLGITARIA